MDLTPLVALRKAKDMTQADLAKHLGITRSLVGKYENNESQPRVDVLEDWCRHLGVELKITL